MSNAANWRLNFGNGQVEMHTSRAAAVRSYNGDQQYREFFRVQKRVDDMWVSVKLTRDETDR